MSVLGHSGKIIQLGAYGKNDRFNEILHSGGVQV